jgi:hypothetical protein
LPEEKELLDALLTDEEPSSISRKRLTRWNALSIPKIKGGLYNILKPLTSLPACKPTDGEKYVRLVYLMGNEAATGNKWLRGFTLQPC